MNQNSPIKLSGTSLAVASDLTTVKDSKIKFKHCIILQNWGYQCWSYNFVFDNPFHSKGAPCRWKLKGVGLLNQNYNVLFVQKQLDWEQHWRIYIQPKVWLWPIGHNKQYPSVCSCHYRWVPFLQKSKLGDSPSQKLKNEGGAAWPTLQVWR